MDKFIRDQEIRHATLSAARYAGLQIVRRPRLAPWLIAVDLGDGRLQLRSAESSYTLTHPRLIHVFRSIEALLDGRHSVEEIVSSADHDVMPTTVTFLLQLLQGQGLLQPGIGESTLTHDEELRWHQQMRFLSHFVPDAERSQSVLATAYVGVAGSGGLRDAVLAALESMGVGNIAQLPDPATWGTKDRLPPIDRDLIVACGESPAHAFFDDVNEACLTSGVRWLRVVISGTSAQLGPTVVPYQTACYTCLELRRRTHEPEQDGYLSYRAQAGDRAASSGEGSLEPLRTALAGQTALEVMRLLIGFAPAATIGRFQEFSAVSPIAISHDILRVPRCESCGRRRTFAEAWDRSVLPTYVEP